MHGFEEVAVPPDALFGHYEAYHLDRILRAG